MAGMAVAGIIHDAKVHNIVQRAVSPSKPPPYHKCQTQNDTIFPHTYLPVSKICNVTLCRAHAVRQQQWNLWRLETKHNKTCVFVYIIFKSIPLPQLPWKRWYEKYKQIFIASKILHISIIYHSGVLLACNVCVCMWCSNATLSP